MVLSLDDLLDPSDRERGDIYPGSGAGNWILDCGLLSIITQGKSRLVIVQLVFLAVNDVSMCVVVDCVWCRIGLV